MHCVHMTCKSVVPELIPMPRDSAVALPHTASAALGPREPINLACSFGKNFKNCNSRND